MENFKVTFLIQHSKIFIMNLEFLLSVLRATMADENIKYVQMNLLYLCICYSYFITFLFFKIKLEDSKFLKTSLISTLNAMLRRSASNVCSILKTM